MFWQILLMFTLSVCISLPRTLAKSLGAAVVPPKSLKSRSTGTSAPLKTETQLRFYELSRLAELPHVFEPKAMGFDATFEIAAIAKQQRKSIVLRNDFQIDMKSSDHLFKHQRGFFIQTKLANQIVSVFFEGYAEEEVAEILNRLERQYSADATEPLSTRVPASAEAVVPKTEDGASHSTSKAVAESFERCGKAAADGFWDPFVSAAKAAELGVRDPSKLWSNTLKDWDRFKEAFRKLEISTPVTKMKELWDLPASEQSRLICNMMGAGANGGALGAAGTKAVANAATKTAVRSSAEAATAKTAATDALPIEQSLASDGKFQPPTYSASDYSWKKGELAGETKTAKNSLQSKETVSQNVDNSARSSLEKPLETFHYSAQEVAGVRKQYPKIAKKIDENDRVLSTKVLGAKRPLSEMLTEDLSKRMETLDPKIKNTMVAIWDKMNDPQAFAIYTRTLSEDAAVEMSKRASKADLALLNQGDFSRSAMLKVLVKRFQKEGNSDFSMVRSKWEGYDEPGGKPRTTSTKKRKIDDNDGFREAVGQGPFFDKPFEGGSHGMDNHFLQVNYVADVVWKETQGNPRLFWDFIGSKKGIRYWTTLFDGGGSNYACPEFIGWTLESKVPLK